MKIFVDCTRGAATAKCAFHSVKDISLKAPLERQRDPVDSHTPLSWQANI